MKIKPNTIMVGVNPYNHKKCKFKYLGKNKGIGSSSHPIRLYDYKQGCEIMITKKQSKLWEIKPYE